MLPCHFTTHQAWTSAGLDCQLPSPDCFHASSGPSNQTLPPLACSSTERVKLVMRIVNQAKAVAGGGCITCVPHFEGPWSGHVRPELCCPVISAFVQLLNSLMIACKHACCTS